MVIAGETFFRSDPQWRVGGRTLRSTRQPSSPRPLPRLPHGTGQPDPAAAVTTAAAAAASKRR